MDETPNMKLPYIMAAQAQKHVTHNEAIRMLDAVVQLSVLDRGLITPPVSPADGERYIVAVAATGAWAGKDNQVAAWQDNAWIFYTPLEGWLCWVGDEDKLVNWDGSGWIGVSADTSEIQNANHVGVNATADDSNRLAVSSPATLFNHEGNGHQIKINKALSTDTASQLFQTGFSGRAEFGLTGDDDFHIKLSPDGSVWREGLKAKYVGGAAQVEIGEHDDKADKLVFNAKTTNGTNVQYSIGDHGVLNAFEFRKPTSNTDLNSAAYYLFNSVGCLTAGNPFWQGMHFAGPAVTESGGNKFPRVSQYWSATLKDDPTDLKFVIRTANTGGLKTDLQFETVNDGDVVFKPGTSGGVAKFDGPALLKSYTVATVPSASASGAGAQIYVSNETGGPVPVFSDGVNWRRVTDRIIIS